MLNVKARPAAILVGRRKQRGIGLFTLLLWIIIGGGLAFIGMEAFPSYSEYQAVTQAVQKAQAEGQSVQQIRSIFEKQATVSYIETISSKDLLIKKVANQYQVSFAYQKKIGLFGPVSLVIDYEGSAGGNQAAPTN